LADSECWEHEGWQGGNAPRYQRDSIYYVLLNGPGGKDAYPHWHALDAAIKEVESGAVFGSASRCCVCGDTTKIVDVFSVFPDRPVYKCASYYEGVCGRSWTDAKVYGDGDDTAIRRIIRARKLYRERGNGKATCKGCIGYGGGERCVGCVDRDHWSRGRYPGPNAPSRHDADGYLAREYNERSRTSVRDECGAIRGLAVICKTCAHRADRCPQGWIALPMPECWKSNGKTHDPYRVIIADGPSCASLDKRLTSAETNVACHEATIGKVEQRVDELEAERNDGLTADAFRVFKDWAERAVDDARGRLRALESAKRVGSDKRGGRRGKK
jgi:hypothetical protein